MDAGILASLALSSVNNIGSVVSSIVNGRRSYKYSKRLMEDQYKYSKKLQKYQNNFTMNMSNTAHQREVADLRAAGLNPILSATGGNGASTPSAGGAMSSMGNVSGTDIDLSNTLGSALDVMRLRNETKLNKSQLSLNDKQGQNLDSSSDLNRSTQKQTEQNILNSIATTSADVRQKDALTSQIKAQTNLLPLELAIKQKQADALVDNYKSSTWRNYNSALGFSSSYEDAYSQSDGYSNGSLGPTNWFPSKGANSSYSHSRRYSESW